MEYVITILVYSFIFGFATKKINESKGYEGGFWLGFILGIIGLIIVACKPDNRGSSQGYQEWKERSQSLHGTYAEMKSRSTTLSDGWTCGQCGRVNPGYTGTCACGRSKKDNTKFKPVSDANVEWVCTQCGRVNPGYTGTCACGQSKRDNIRIESVLEVEKAEKEIQSEELPKFDKETKNIQLLKSYKELLDAGVITQEEFEKKKAEILQ